MTHDPILDDATSEDSSSEGVSAAVIPDMNLGDSNTTVWSLNSNCYHPSNTAAHRDHLEPGLYRYEAGMTGWWLAKTGPNFTFPYKIYGSHSHIIERITKAWDLLPANLGILLNGVKGTGKTVTAQLVANWAIEQGFPVLVVHGPVPLSGILERIHQPVLVIFDEFEKTHAKPEEQQALLTAVDGMSRNEFKRLFIFTTNSKTVDPNFIDRPSRIRYLWEFGRLSDEVIAELLEDMLDPELSEMRAPIQTYLATRKVLSIDVAKTVITECNIFREAPETFKSAMNLSEQEARGFTLDVVDDKGEPLRELSSYFKVNRGYTTRLMGLLNRTGQQAYVEDHLSFNSTFTFSDNFTHLAIDVQQPTNDPNIWVCHLKLPFRDTWVRKFKKVEDDTYSDSVWLDQKPEDWAIPEWASKVHKGIELTEEEDQAQDTWNSSDTVYGTGEYQKVLIRITPNYDVRSYATWAPQAV